MQTYMKALIRLYREQPALFQKDYDPSGFEWINCMDADENLLSFMRRGEKPEDDLLIIVNFSPLVYEKHKVGVPYNGKFKEIFNSDSKEFGGDGNTNPRAKSSKKVFCDDRENSIEILVPPMGISVFKCTKVEEKAEPKKPAAKKAETVKKAAPSKKPAPAKKAAPAKKKATAKKTTAAKKTTKE